MKLNRFLILSNREKNQIIEYEYAYYWVDGYKYVDARYLYAGKSKRMSLDYIRLFAYKLFYLNPSSPMEDIADLITKIMDNKTENGNPIYLMEQDIFKCVSEVFKSIESMKDLSRIARLKKPLNINKGIYENNIKKIEFKTNLQKLLQMTEQEEEKYKSLTTKENKLDYKFDLDKKKKREYAMSIINKHKTKETNGKILSALEVLADEKETITYNEIANLADVSIVTAYNYLTKKNEELNKIKGQTCIVNLKTKKKMDCIEHLKDCIQAMRENKLKINKTTLSENSKVSRVTITKYWNQIQ